MTALRTDRLAGMDFEAHNAEVRAMWEAFHRREPYRIPCTLGVNTRYHMFSPDANPGGVLYRDYCENPDVMYDAQLGFARWSRFNLLQDAELGMPERFAVGVDFQNFYEAAWLGCPIEYMDDQVPDTVPVFADCPERVMEKGIPDPFGGLFARGVEFVERMRERAKAEEYLGRPVSVYAPGGGTDGPMTVASNLCGPDVVCEMMAEDPDRLHVLFDFITESIVRRIGAWRVREGVPAQVDGFWMADDSVALISTPMYRDHVMPFHRRIYDALGTPVGRGMHLCGNSQRHFVTIRDELGVSAFDTGFPIDFARLRAELGPDVLISGGPHVEFLLSASPEAVRTETRRVLNSGITQGGRFNLREGNNLAPHTPLENTEAMFHACREFGRLSQGPTL